MIEVIVDILWVGAPLILAGGGWGIAEFASKKEEERYQASLQPKLIDGKTEHEWYEILSGMDKKDFELLTEGVIDVRQSDDGEWKMDYDPKYGMNVKRLTGTYYNKLMRNQYPERICQYCNQFDCKATCWEKTEHDRIKREIAARKRRQENKAKELEWWAHNLKARPSRKSHKNS